MGELEREGKGWVGGTEGLWKVSVIWEGAAAWLVNTVHD